MPHIVENGHHADIFCSVAFAVHTAKGGPIV